MMKTVVANNFVETMIFYLSINLSIESSKEQVFFLVTLLSFFNIAFDQEVSLENKVINFF